MSLERGDRWQATSYPPWEPAQGDLAKEATVELRTFALGIFSLWKLFQEQNRAK